MNLALHGFLLQVIVSILNFKHGFRLCSAGEPGYLDFDNLPETNFSCQGKVIGGYYADVEAGCQMFHVCTIGQKDEIMDIKFLCLNGTVFDQETRVCERVDEVDCSKSERFYNLNLELYGNHAVTLSLHEEDDDDSTEHHDEHQQQQQLHITSARPSTTSTTTSTTSRPSQQSTTSATNVYQQHPTGYPQHYQPRPAFSSIQTSQSNTHYDDKNGGYHHQYIFHNDERSNDNQATSYQLFSNQGVSSTTPTSQVHQQVRYSSTMNPQVIHNEPSTVSPLQYHVQSTSSTIQTLLNSNSNNPALINPIFHNHGIASTTEQFNVHNNNPREINDYQDDSEDERDEQPERRPLEPVQSTNKGKVSKLTISPVPRQQSRSSVTQTKSSQSTQQQRISINFLPTPNPVQTTISAFYPTQRSTQQTQKSQNNPQVTQHIHVPPPPSIPQLKPQQITINLPPPDIQRIVQNPSPLLPSQSRVIVTAKASVSDESGRPLNASQLITLPLSTIPSNYDDYKEGDESFDPFYRDVPKIRHNQRIIISRKVEANERSRRKKRSTVKDNSPTEEVIYNAEIKDIKDLKANLPIIKAILFGLPIPENKESSSDIETTNNKTTIKMITDNLYNNNESRKSIPVQNEEKYIDVEVPEVIAIEENKKNSKSVKSRINNIHQELEFQRPSNTLQRQIDFNPIIVNQGKDDTELKNSIKLLLGEAKNGNSSPRNKYSAINVEVLNSSNEKKDNNDTFVEKELLQTRSSSHANKSNRRRYQNSESLESDEYTVRRSERINRPKSSKYYDEYDTSESVESNTKQRSNRLRQRPKNRRIINYRDDYIDEDIEDEEYDEENIRRTHKNRRGPQSRRTSFRNRNNHFDYEEDEEVDEKPRVRAKSSNVSNRSRIKSETDTFVEDKRHKSDTERRKNQRKRPTVFEDDTPSEENTEILNGQNFEESDSKLSKEIDPRVIVQENKKHSRYSLKSEQDKQHHLSTKKRYNSLERDEESGEELNDQIREDYLDPEELYSDEYNESVEEDVPDDYVDYEDSRDQISSAEIEHQKNRNKFDDDLELIPQSKSHRRNKGRKFVEETKINLEDAEKKLEYEDIDTTTLSENQESKTINISVESTTSEQITTLKDEDYNSEKITSVIDDFENTESPEYIKSTIEDITTEGVFKFTGELPQIEKKDNEQENSKQKDKEVIDVEDYVDDNYEPLSYIDPQIKEPVFSLMNNAENDKHVLTINDQPKEIQKISNTSINISEFEMKNNKENDETYDDKLEKTTIFSSSEDYDNTEITETDIIHKTSSPIPSSTAASPLSILSLMNSTTSTSTSTSTILTTSMPTITTTSTTTTSTTTTSTTTTPTTTTSTTTTTVKPISTKSTPTTLSTKATPKFFKPTRKNYVYIPPSTTPNAVVIRRGQPLAGPKPTKPPPSYNELAPKPVIRRLPLLSRTTTTTSEATILEENIAAELSKHLAQDSRKNVKKNETSIPEVQNITTSPEITKVSTVSSVTKSQSTEITTEDFELTTLSINQTSVPETSTALPVVQNQSAESKEQNFDNEVPKQSSVSNNSNNLPQQSDDSIAETSKPQGESITFDQEDLTNLEITTLNMDSDSKIVDSRTTTPRNVKPSERRKLELTSVKTQIQKSKWGPKQSAGFNCLEKEMYRFYGDSRDCRLFHYCSPGFTARQVLDFRFVCEEGTIFDEESQSCRHDVPNPKCLKRTL